MSYTTINTSANDPELQGRVTAACAQEGETGNPQSQMFGLIWWVCTRADVEAAYASALVGGNPHPGADDTVVTDNMILSAVQSAPPVTPPG
jgi:hypothetical protein